MSKARDYFVDKDKFFILSDVNKSFMQKHNLPGTVAQLRARVVCTIPFKTVRTGIFDKVTKVYRVSDFQQSCQRQTCYIKEV